MMIKDIFALRKINYTMIFDTILHINIKKN